MKRTIENITHSYRSACIATACFLEQHFSRLLFLLGAMLLTTGLIELSHAQGGGPTGTFATPGFDDALIRAAVGNLFKLVEGAFGALIMVVSGIGAIIASAMGAYRAAVGMLVVAVGSFILRSLVSLFFGSDFQDYEAS